MNLESHVRRWLGDDGLCFVAHGEIALVNAILGSYQLVRAEEIERRDVLAAMAAVCGYANIHAMLGASICGADGSRTLTLRPV